LSFQLEKGVQAYEAGDLVIMLMWQACRLELENFKIHKMWLH